MTNEERAVMATEETKIIMASIKRIADAGELRNAIVTFFQALRARGYPIDDWYLESLQDAPCHGH